MAGIKHRVLIVSNGHGEDLLGVLFATALQRQDNSLHVDAFPVVGDGGAYRGADIGVVGIQKAMPSGGFLRQGIKPLLADIRAGFIQLTRRQIRWLRQHSDAYTWVVAMGDIYPLWLCGRYVKRPFVFFPTAKSDYIRPHNKLEISWMKRWPLAVFTRDQITAESLQHHGIQATYHGNMMMDALQKSEKPLPGDGRFIAILPGSREEAYNNAKLLLQAVQRLSPSYSYAVALAGELDAYRFGQKVRYGGWTWQAADEDSKQEIGLQGTLHWQERTVFLYKGRFADILHKADAVLGMAGTANEQAVGLGKPVITCAGEGPQFTAAFVTAQRKLLGESVLVTQSAPDALAEGVQRVFRDPELYERMAAVGTERMGETGAANRLARYCLRLEELSQ